jgi:hypothetical protein
MITKLKAPTYKPWRGALLALLASTSLGGVQAADAVSDTIQAAYAPYRAALFTTNGKSAPDAQAAVEKASAAWRALSTQFKGQPSAPYDRDPAFADTLQRVQAVYNTAEQQAKAGKLPEAHETLEAARDLIGEMRRRNGVIVYSDHMNAYHAQMEHVLTDGAKLLTQAGQPGTWMNLAAQAGVLDYLAQRLRSEAPAALAGQAEFTGLLDAVLAVNKSFNQAVQRQDEAQARDALAKLKSPYSRLFLKFG